MKIKDLPVNIHIRLWGSFANRIASSAVWPFMALYLTEMMNKTFAGTFLSLTVLLSFVLNIIAGYVCDMVPRKKLILIATYSEALFIFLMALSIYQSWIVMFLISFIAILTVGQFRRPALRAIVQDAATSENKKLVYQLDYWLINLSLALGAAIGGLFYHDHQLALFILLGSITLIIAIVYTIFLEDHLTVLREKVHSNVLKDLLHSYQLVLKNKQYVIFVIGSICIMYAELCTSSYIAVRLSETFKTIHIFGFEMTGVRMFSTLNIINTLMVVTCTFAIGKIASKMKVRHAMLLGLIVYGIGYTVLTSANHILLILVAMVIATLGELFYAPIKNAEELELIPADQRGAYGAFSSLGFNSSDLLSKFAIIIGAYLNPYAMSIVMAVIVFIGSVCYMSSLYGKANNKTEPKY